MQRHSGRYSECTAHRERDGCKGGYSNRNKGKLGYIDRWRYGYRDGYTGEVEGLVPVREANRLARSIDSSVSDVE